MTSLDATAPLTVQTASELLRAGDLSAVELLDLVVERIEATEPRVHAYVSLDLDRARRDAVEADRTPSRGPLHGIPFGVKDVFAVAGEPTGCGSRALADHVTPRDAAVVSALRAAGAVLVGKQTTHELTCGVDEPPTRNPYDPTRYPGGSSAGAGVSVAVGSALFSLGTDAAGSVRNPASVNGIVGLKPTYGLLSTEGVVRAATAPSIDHVGILARTVADTALVLDTLAPGSVGAIHPGLRGVRLGVVGEVAGLEPAVAGVVDAAVAELAAAGAELVTVELPELRDAPGATATLFAAELAAGNRELLARRPADYHPAVRQLLAAGADTPEAELQRAEDVRAKVLAAVTAAFDRARLDALVSPTLPLPPPTLAELDPATYLPRFVAYTSPFNLTGQPAVSVPCGVTSAGLPVGLQIAGRSYRESSVLRIAACVTPPAFPVPPPWS